MSIDLIILGIIALGGVIGAVAFAIILGIDDIKEKHKEKNKK